MIRWLLHQMVVTANTFSSTTTTTTTDGSLKRDVPTGNFLSYVGSLWYKGNFPYPERTIEEQAKIRHPPSFCSCPPSSYQSSLCLCESEVRPWGSLHPSFICWTGAGSDIVFYLTEVAGAGLAGPAPGFSPGKMSQSLSNKYRDVRCGL